MYIVSLNYVLRAEKSLFWITLKGKLPDEVLGKNFPVLFQLLLLVFFGRFPHFKKLKRSHKICSMLFVHKSSKIVWDYCLNWSLVFRTSSKSLKEFNCSSASVHEERKNKNCSVSTEMCKENSGTTKFDSTGFSKENWINVYLSCKPTELKGASLLPKPSIINPKIHFALR